MCNKNVIDLAKATSAIFQDTIAKATQTMSSIIFSAQPGYVNITASYCEDAKLRAWAWCPLALHALPPLQKVSGMQDSSSLLVLVVFVHPAPRSRTKVPHQGLASVSQVAAKLWRNSVWHSTWKLRCAWDCHSYGATLSFSSQNIQIFSSYWAANVYKSS